MAQARNTKTSGSSSKKAKSRTKSRQSSGQKQNTVRKAGASGKTNQSDKVKSTGAGSYYRDIDENPEYRRHQTNSIVIFSIGIFLLAVAVIPGASLWHALRIFLYGLFGRIGFIIFSASLIYTSIISALDNSKKPISTSFFQFFCAIVLLCSIIHIFAFESEDGYFASIGKAYSIGMEWDSGGVIGAMFGGLFLEFFGKAGAVITILIITFTYVMLVTHTSIIGLVSLFVTKLTNEAGDNIDYDGADVSDGYTRPDFDIDVDIEDHSQNDTVEEILKKKKRGKKADRLSVNERETVSSGGGGTDGENIKPVVIDDIVEKITNHNLSVETGSENANSKAEGQPEKASVQKLNAGYKKPSVQLLNKNNTPRDTNIGDELKNNATLLVDTLKSFGVETRIIDINRGPAVTRYELQPAAGVKISKITNLADDIALNLAATGVRIEAPIPNKSAVGIEVPNKYTSTVTMREVIESEEYKKAKSKITVALGKDIAGNVAVADLAKMPHILIAGATGSGKSVCINSFIISILYNATPDEVKFIMIDPKVVELGVYNGIPHLEVPVVTDPRKAAGALIWAVSEMLNRYKMFADNNVRDIFAYNQLCKKDETLRPLHQIVIIIDELADLMMVAPNEIEDSICRLAQMARAAGMHLVIATQRPSVDVITGIIKANIPSRIAFSVSSQVDSRTILDMAGAEKLLGMGDMLFHPMGASKPVRIQGCYVSDKEIERVVDYIKQNSSAEYNEEVMSEIERQAVQEKKKNNQLAGDVSEGDVEDEMLPKAVECVVEAGIASTTLLQRKLRLGYARAARLIDELESRGIVGPFEGSKPRRVLITKIQWLEMQATSATHAPEPEDAYKMQMPPDD